MTTDGPNKKDETSATHEESPSSRGERVEEIKREEQEDASGYYAQGDSQSDTDDAAEFDKAVEPIKAEREEMNMLKAIAFLGFGMAALAIIFILFFVRNLDTRVVGMDGTMTSLEEKIAPLKKRVDDGLRKVNEDISGLQVKVNSYERTMAVMELKRALVTVQEMSLGHSTDIKAKSGDVVAGIEALLNELEARTLITAKGMPAGIVSLEEAPAAVAPEIVDEPVAESAAEESHEEETRVLAEAATELEVDASEEVLAEEPAESTAEENSEGGDDEEDNDDDDDEEADE